MNKKKLFALFAILLFAVPMVPVDTWVYQNGDPEDTKFEKFGPRADKLLIKLYVNETTEWEALARGEIDIADATLTREYYDNFTSNKTNPFTGQPYNETINTVSHGAEFRIYLLGINNWKNEFLGNPPNPAYPNPVYPNPCGVKEFRQAIAHLADRSQLDAIIGGGLYVPLYTVVPPSMGAYVHPEIRPGGALENLIYPYSRASAEALLDANGFPVNSSTGWRYWDRNGNGIEDADEYLELKFVIRDDHAHRRDFGTFFASELEAVKIRVNAIYTDVLGAVVYVFYERDFHLYTERRSLGEEPDFLYYLFHSDFYWYPGYCYNYNGIMDSTYDEVSWGVALANTEDEAIQNAHLAQEIFASNAFKVPLWSYAGNKAMNRFYTGGNGWQPVTPNDGENAYRGNYWEGIVNRLGYGIDNFWSFLNMHPKGYNRGDAKNMTIRWAFKTAELRSFNPVYAEWLWEWNVLNLIYESLLVRNPYNRAEFIPWLVEDYELGIYNHQIYGPCTKVKFTLRPDVTWADGTPLTVADVFFTFIELDDILRAQGLPPPWWYSNIANILGFKIFDPYNFEVLFDVKSIWVLGWISNTPILPKHIWKPLAEAGAGVVDDPAADPNMIGSGPWRFQEYAEGSHVLLVANRPGSIVQTSHPGSTSINSPKGYHRYHPVRVAVRVDGTTKARIDYYTQPHTIDYAVINLYLSGNITVNISLTYPNGTTYTETEIVIPDGGNWTYSWTGNLQQVKTTGVVVTIISPTEFEGVYSWSQIYYGTVKEDVAGSTFYDDIGLPDYPYKSELPTPDIRADIRDIAIVAKAFGSYPGHERWGMAIGDNCDYKIDIRDISGIAKQYGWTG